MNYCEFINRINFRIFKPDTPILTLGFDRFTQRLRFGVKLEIYNTRFPRNGRNLKRKLSRICYIPKMSTCAIGGIINQGVYQLSPENAFVNVGVWKGFSLLCGMAGNEDKTCIGVDNFSEFGGPKSDFYDNFRQYRSANHHFYEMDYVEYFSQVHDKRIGFYIYDGEHSYENQLKGLQIAEPHFAKNCLILVDDTNYEEARRGTKDFVKQSPYTYEVIFDRRTYCNSHPTFWNGVMILQRTS